MWQRQYLVLLLWITDRFFINNKKVNIKSPEDAIKNKIAFITENRREEGVVLDNDVKVNITMATIDNIIGRLKLIDNKKEEGIAKTEIKNTENKNVRAVTST